MRTTSMEPAYFSTYRSLKLTRNAEGVLIGEFHSGGGPLIFRAQDHTEFVEAFYRISQDRGNKVVILTGTGREFIPDIDFSSFGTYVTQPFGAKFTMRAPRFWRTSLTSVCR